MTESRRSDRKTPRYAHSYHHGNGEVEEAVLVLFELALPDDLDKLHRHLHPAKQMDKLTDRSADRSDR
jgi:hypothetical protein